MSKSINVEIELDSIQEAIKKSVDDITSSKYSNPIKKMVEKAIKEKEDEIKGLVKEIISKSLTDPKFKEQMGDMVIQNVVQKAMKC